jgi:Tol biopolymer transport system component
MASRGLDLARTMHPDALALFRELADWSPSQREAYYVEHHVDAALRAEVESLLRFDRQTAGSINNYVAAAAAEVLADQSSSSSAPEQLAPHTTPSAMSTTPSLAGHRFGVFEVQGLMGAGGMGEVYRARDTRLGRDVAVKILSRAFREDRERIVRFEREARVLAALNHPNIGVVYGLEEADGLKALVMELVEGEDLAARLRRRSLPLDEALDVARQVAEALAAAHAQGIVHRDLKPANIKRRPDGQVKVLDFGLAKALVWNDAVSATQTGVVGGTPAYMSPEQVRGEVVDTQSDIWSFGVVLFELLTAVSPFARRTTGETLATVLSAAPDYSLLPDHTPSNVRRLIRRCLEKDRRRRLKHIGDAGLELEEALAPSGAHDAADPAHGQVLIAAQKRRTWQGLAVLMAAIALGIAAWVFQPTAPGSPGRFEAPGPENVTLYDDVSVSPDGRKLAFTAAAPGGLWLRDLDALEWRRLPGTEGASTPFWSPDSRYVGFIVDNTLRRVDTTGGPPETVTSVPTAALRSGTWNRHGDIVLGSWGGGSGGPLWRVSPAGGAATAVTEVDLSKGEFVHTGPTFLPDGNHFLYFRSGPPDVEGMYVGSLDVDAGNQSRQRILATDVPAIFANDYLFFLRAGTLMAQPFDARRMELQDVPVPVAEDIAITWYFTGVFSVSDGVLVYRTASAPGTFQLTWVDRQGKTLGTFGPPGTDWRVVLSPDGTRAVAKDAPYNVPGDLWMLDLANGRRTRFTFNKEVYSPAVWSRDGARIAYSAGRLGDTIYEKAASGLGDEQVLLKEPGLRHHPTSWSRDGRFLLYHTENAPNTGYDLWALSLSDRQPHLMLGEAFNEWAGVFSPDMRWIAYVSLETGGAAEVYVRPFRVSGQTGQPSFGEGKWQILKGQANWPQWRIDREIVFNTAPFGTAVFAAPVNTTGTAFESGVPQRLPFPPSIGVSTTPQSTPDGQRFLIEVPLDQPAARTSISVVLNWPALLKQ